MIIKVRITTPKGHAKKASKNLRGLLIGSKKHLLKSYVNEEDNELYWEIDLPIRKAITITKKVEMYKEMIHTVLGNKTVKKMIKDEQQKKELENMLNDQTKIEIVKEASAQEMVEHNKNFWTKMKETFKKI